MSHSANRKINQHGPFRPRGVEPAGKINAIDLAYKKAEICRSCELSISVEARAEHPSEFLTLCDSDKCKRCNKVSLISGDCPEGKFTKYGLV